MKFQIVALLSAAVSSSATLFSEDPVQQKYLWDAFKQEHNKAYDTMDLESRKFSIFLENIKMADLRNEAEIKNGGSAVHGITKLSDLSQSEFSAHYLTADASMKSGKAQVMKISGEVDMAAGLVDWSGKLTTPVKDQV